MMPQMLFFLSLIVTMVMFAGCGENARPSALRDLAVDREARNIAVLVGAPTNLPGIDLDLNMMNEILSTPEVGFEIRRSWRQSAADVLATVRQAAVDVGDNGTLFFFFSGHGAQNGHLFAESGGMINFDRITAAIKDARTRPLKRFMVFVDACYSGHLVNGTVAVGRDDRPEATVIGLRGVDQEKDLDLQSLSASLTSQITTTLTKDSGSYASALADQLLVVSAANRNTTSLAGGDGSTFTKGVWQAFRDLAKTRGTTIRTFLKQVHDNTRRNSGGHHAPVYRVYPENTVLDDLLTGSTPIPNSGSGGVHETGIDQDLAVALGALDAAGRSQVFIAGVSGLTRVLVCKGTHSGCLASPMAAIDVSPSKIQVTGRSVYETTATLTLPENEVYTVIGYGAGGKVVSAASFKFARK